MNIFSKILHKAGDALNFNKKFYDIPTVTGGFDIFRNLSWDDGISQSKQMKLYQKSLYVFACVTKIAQKTASIDWELYRIKNKSGDKEEMFISPILDLLYRPNPWQTKGEFFEKFMINKKLAGEAFILKVRDERGVVRELWNLRPDFMTIVKDKETFIKAFEFNANGQKIVFKPEDVIHDAYPNPLDEYGGISPLCAADIRVETELSAVTYQKNFFRNNARPDFLLSTDGKIRNEQKEEIKEGWEKRHKGVQNSGKGAFLEGGVKYQQVSISQREMDYIESLKMTRDDILTAFGVPKPIVAITDDVNLANAQTAMEIFLSETIVPEIKRLTEKLNEHLVYPEFGDVFFIDYEDPVPTNDKSVAEVQDIKLKNGTLLINEAREELGLEPVVGGWSLYMPVMNVAVGGLPQSAKSKFISKDKRKIFRGRSKAMKFLEVREQVEDMIYKGLEKDIREVAKKAETRSFIAPEIREVYFEAINKAIDQKGDAFKPTVLKFGEDQKSRVLKELSAGKSFSTKAINGLIDITKENKLLAEISLPFIQDFLVSAGQEAMQLVNPSETFSITERVQKFIKERAKEMAKSVNDTTVEKLARTLAEGIGAGEGITDLTARVNYVYDEYPTYRAEMIARTEATAANNRGFVESYQQSGVANAKEWINSGDGRVRDEHLDGIGVGGEIVGVDDDFSNGLPYPSEVNCRCVLGPAFKE